MVTSPKKANDVYVFCMDDLLVEKRGSLSGCSSLGRTGAEVACFSPNHREHREYGDDWQERARQGLAVRLPRGVNRAGRGGWWRRRRSSLTTWRVERADSSRSSVASRRDETRSRAQRSPLSQSRAAMMVFGSTPCAKPMK